MHMTWPAASIGAGGYGRPHAVQQPPCADPREGQACARGAGEALHQCVHEAGSSEWTQTQPFISDVCYVNE